jgi:hypothetical protein
MKLRTQQAVARIDASLVGMPNDQALQELQEVAAVIKNKIWDIQQKVATTPCDPCQGKGYTIYKTPTDMLCRVECKQCGGSGVRKATN